MQAMLVATARIQSLPLLTQRTPAPLLPIVNRPVMAHAVEIVARAGIKQILVSLTQHGGQVASYFGNGRSWGVQFEYLMQQEARSVAEMLHGAAPRIHETLLVLPADAVLDLDIEAALASHQAQGSQATLVLHAQKSAGALTARVNSFGRVQQIGDENSDAALYWTGACILEPSVFAQLDRSAKTDDQAFMTALLAAELPVFGHVTEAYWNPLATLAHYHEAQHVFLHSAYVPADGQQSSAPRIRYPSIEGQQIAPGIWVGRNHAIHPDARLAAPLCLGDGCLVGDDVELGPDTVIGPYSILDDGATVTCSTVAAHTYVGRLVNLVDRVVEQAMIIDPSTAQHVEIVDPFLLSAVALEHPRRLQRGATVLTAGLLLLCAVPLMLLIGLAVACTTGGRVFRYETRLGRRATATDATADATFMRIALFNTRHDDGSPTLLGPWLRRWSLDHLPSLWNVLKGDLNLVGVKPLTVEEATYMREIWHEKRNDAPAGLTGLWFVQTDRDSDADAVLVADAYYAATRTWRADARVLAQTPSAWLRRARHTVSIPARTSHSLPSQTT